MSTAVKVATGVVVSVAGTAAIIVGVYIAMKKRRKFQFFPNYSKSGAQNGGWVYEKAELAVPGASNTHEMPSVSSTRMQFHELEGDRLARPG